MTNIRKNNTHSGSLNGVLYLNFSKQFSIKLKLLCEILNQITFFFFCLLLRENERIYLFLTMNIVHFPFISRAFEQLLIICLIECSYYKHIRFFTLSRGVFGFTKSFYTHIGLPNIE